MNAITAQVVRFANERSMQMSFQPGFNPFANQDIFFNKAFHETVKELAKFGVGDGEHEGVSGTPFKRMIDAWLLAVAIGSMTGLPAPEVSEGGMIKVINGAVLQKDLEAISFLMSIAVAETGDPYVVEDPRRMIRIAMGFADLGFPRLIELSEDGYLGATENLGRGLIKILEAN